MRVLLVKMSSLGDVVHTLPALTDAAGALAGLRVDWVVEEAFTEIPAWHPAVDRVIPVALRRWRKRPLHSLRGPQWARFRAELAERRYDAVIDAQGLLKSAVVARLVSAPCYGLDRRSAREGIASLAYQHRVHVPRDMHAVERTRQLFARSLRYKLPDTTGNYGVRPGLQALAVPSTGPSLLFFHGTARREKLWPREHWVELVLLAAGEGYRVLLPWGNEVERERAAWIARHSPAARVLPRMGLGDLAGRLLAARGAVAVDTGLGHLAAALDVPTVSLYGPTSTHLVGAYGKHQVHVRSPAQSGDPADLMRAITAAEVWRSLQSALAAEA